MKRNTGLRLLATLIAIGSVNVVPIADSGLARNEQQIILLVVIGFTVLAAIVLSKIFVAIWGDKPKLRAPIKQGWLVK